MNCKHEEKCYEEADFVCEAGFCTKHCEIEHVGLCMNEDNDDEDFLVDNEDEDILLEAGAGFLMG